MERKFSFERIAIFFVVLAALFGFIKITEATDTTHYSNYVQTGDRVVIEFATTSPTVGDPVVKSAAKATGGIIGVAMNGSATAAEDVVVSTTGVFNLAVVASSTVGNIAVGDYVYGSIGGLEVCTTTLSNINTGIIFGQALDAITASTTAKTIRVRLLQPAHL